MLISQKHPTKTVIITSEYFFQNDKEKLKILVGAFNQLCKLNGSKRDTYLSIKTISTLLVDVIKIKCAIKKYPNFLIPILRGAYPMYEAINARLGYCTTYFCVGKKIKEEKSANINWIKPIAINSDNNNVFIIDTIVATGDTIKEIIKALPNFKNINYYLIVTYISPEAIIELEKINYFRLRWYNM